MSTKDTQYYEGVGRRKTAVARVRIMTNDKKGSVVVNDKSLEEFFGIEELRKVVISPLEEVSKKEDFFVSVKVRGGGQRGQAEAIQLGLARALVKVSGDFGKTLGEAGYLKRDPRQKERKKPGLKKARKRPQWSKR